MTHNSADKSLAEEIAEGLGESDSIQSILTLIKRYSEQTVRKAYEDALAIPTIRIRKSRGALFIYLLKKYARSDEYSS